jgi:hypothetical protein
MRLRRAVLKIPAKSSVPPRLPLRKNRSLRTRSESTLPQSLIPLDFKSFISNVYKKPREGVPRSGPKFLQLVTPMLLSFRARRGICFFFPPSLLPYFVTSLHHTCSSSISSWVYFITRVHPGRGYFTRSRPYLITSLLLCFRLLSHSNNSGCSRVMRSHMGWNWNQPASGMPTCECVSLAVS